MRNLKAGGTEREVLQNFTSREFRDRWYIPRPSSPTRVLPCSMQNACRFRLCNNHQPQKSVLLISEFANFKDNSMHAWSVFFMWFLKENACGFSKNHGICIFPMTAVSNSQIAYRAIAKERKLGEEFPLGMAPPPDNNVVSFWKFGGSVFITHTIVAISLSTKAEMERPIPSCCLASVAGCS